MEDKFNSDCLNHYLKIAKETYPDKDEHLLKIAVAQYLLIDIEGLKPDPNNEDFLKAKKEYSNKVY